MKEKLLNIIKKAGRISIDDLSMIVGAEEVTVIKLLQPVIKEGQIKQVEDLLIFIGQKVSVCTQPAGRNKRKYNNNFVPRDEFELQRYLQNSKCAKEIFDNYMELIEKTNHLKGKELMSFLEVWNKENPNKQVAYNTLANKRAQYAKYGTLALIPRKGKFIQAEMKPEWTERYSELYLSPDMLPERTCREIVLQEVLKNDPTFDEHSFPSHSSFRRYIQSNYTIDEVNQFRKFKKITVCSVKKSDTSYDNSFNNVAENFINLELKTKCDFLSTKAKIKIINNHLLPFFKDFEYSWVLTKDIEKYKILKLQEGLPQYDVERHVKILKKIINSAYKNPDILIKHNKKKVNIDIQLLKHLLKTAKYHYPYLYTVLMLAIMTGLTKTKILSLKWDNIDLINDFIIISEERQVKIPACLKFYLKKWKIYSRKNSENYVCVDKSGNKLDLKNFDQTYLSHLFNKAKVPQMTFFDFTDAYAGFLLNKNAPINFLKEQINDRSIDFTYSKYGHYMPEFNINSVGFEVFIDDWRYNQCKDLFYKAPKAPTNLAELRLADEDF